MSKVVSIPTPSKRPAKAPADSKDGLQALSLGELLALPLRPPETLLAPWLTDCHLGMIYSASGVGKSYLTLSIALAVAGGGQYLEWKAPRPRGVLLVDGEMDLRDLKARAAQLIPFIGGDPTAAANNLTILAQQGQDLSVEFPDLGTDEGQEVVLEMIGRLDPALVILDNFSTLCQVEDENAAASFNPIQRFMRRLKQSGTSVLLVHHSRKDDKSWRGSQMMSVVLNSIIHLSKPEGRPTVGPAQFAISFEKFRGDPRDLRELEVTLRDDGWHFEPLVADHMAELLRLLRSLEYGTQTALAEALGVDKATVTRMKRAAIQKGLITGPDWDDCLSAAQEGQEDY